jgi:hypothetical protein
MDQGLDFNLLTIGRVKEKPDVPISEPGRFVDDSSLETSGFMRMLRT